jgi:hypothetical protein
MSSTNYLAIFLSFCALFVIGFILFDNRNSICKDALYSTPLYINDKKLCVEVVDTPEKMQKGLGERSSLGENQGMLFIFPNKNNLTFWMKDMKFDIDMIWIDDNKIVDVSKNATYPKGNVNDKDLEIYSSQIPANKVLEVSANFFDNNNISIGDLVH